MLGSMEVLQKAALAAIVRCGGVKPTARALKLSPGTVSRVANGKRLDVPDHVAKKLGVRRLVVFEPLPGRSFP
jgi:hypothetical protein